jgi:phospholipid transport system substrate-binding protein
VGRFTGDKEESLVTSWRSVACQAAVVSILAFPVNAWAAQSPLEMIRATVKSVMAVLQNPSLQGAEHQQERNVKAQAIILPHFDAQALAQRALGLYWRERTTDQKREFAQLFLELVEKTYSGTLDRYTKDVQVFFDREQVDNDSAEVDTRVVAPSQQEPISMNYYLHEVGGQWLVYDVQIDDVSMVLNYRNQFSRVISSSSYEDLIQKIKSKLKN